MDRRKNLQGDHFTHSIDLLLKDGTVYEHIGGINNVAVANIAFDELRHYHGKDLVVELRCGAYVMRKSRGFGRYRERFMETKSDKMGGEWPDDNNGLWPD